MFFVLVFINPVTITGGMKMIGKESERWNLNIFAFLNNRSATPSAHTLTHTHTPTHAHLHTHRKMHNAGGFILQCYMHTQKLENPIKMTSMSKSSWTVYIYIYSNVQLYICYVTRFSPVITAPLSNLWPEWCVSTPCLISTKMFHRALIESTGGQIGGIMMCPFSGITSSGRVWRKGAGKQGLECDTHTLYAFMWTHTHMCACMHACVCAYLHACVCVVNVCMHVCVRVSVVKIAMVRKVKPSDQTH